MIINNWSSNKEEFKITSEGSNERTKPNINILFEYLINWTVSRSSSKSKNSIFPNKYN